MESNYYRYYERTLTTGIERNDVIINVNRIVIPLGLRYELENKRWPIYFTGGINFSSHSRITIEHILESVDEETITINYSEEPFTPKSGQIGLWAGAGIYLQVLERKRLFLELKYENTNGVVKRINGRNQALASSISNLKLLLGITL